MFRRRIDGMAGAQVFEKQIRKNRRR